MAEVPRRQGRGFASLCMWSPTNRLGNTLRGLRSPVIPGLAAFSHTISQPGLVSARGDLEAPIQCQNSSDTLASLRGGCPSPGHLSLCPCPWHPWCGLGGAALRDGRVQGHLNPQTGERVQASVSWFVQESIRAPMFLKVQENIAQ